MKEANCWSSIHKDKEFWRFCCQRASVKSKRYSSKEEALLALVVALDTKIHLLENERVGLKAKSDVLDSLKTLIVGDLEEKFYDLERDVETMEFNKYE